jgi:hypothetical protein
MDGVQNTPHAKSETCESECPKHTSREVGDLRERVSIVICGFSPQHTAPKVGELGGRFFFCTRGTILFSFCEPIFSI